MNLHSTTLPGCYEIFYPAQSDARGMFIKICQASAFTTSGLNPNFAETLYTVSRENVLRGMHFQLPPCEQSKLVYCVSGGVMDIALDLRRGSPMYGKHLVFDLSADRHNALYLPAGIAHGFYVQEAPALMFYHLSAEYAPKLDAGIAWDSFGAEWPAGSPLISKRDAALPPLSDFESPFHYSAAAAAHPNL